MARNLARVVQSMDNAIHRINQYLAERVVCFDNTYPVVIYPVDNVIQPSNNRGQLEDMQ